MHIFVRTFNAYNFPYFEIANPEKERCKLGQAVTSNAVLLTEKV